MKPNALARRTKGFTLIEVLVAVLILAIGLLGLAGLQAASMRNSQSALMRSQATILAEDIMDRIRANTNNASLAAYMAGTAEANGNCTNATGCNADAMAKNDLFEWYAALARELANGDGTVCRDSTPEDGTPADPACDGSGRFVVKVWWNDERDGELQLFFTSFCFLRDLCDE